MRADAPPRQGEAIEIDGVDTSMPLDLETLFGLRGRRAVVIGGTSGLGAAVCHGLAAAGAEVIVAGRDQARGRQVVDSCRASGPQAHLERVDVSDPGSIAALYDRVTEGYGPVDILVNSAGVFLRDAALDATAEDGARSLAVNVTGTFAACQLFGRGMLQRGYGRIVNFASTDGMVGVPGQAAYCASKGAVVQLTRTLGAEWIGQGVCVNAVGPCDFATPMIRGALDEPEYRAWILEAIPAGRVGRPGEIVGAVLYLASPAAAMVAGHILMVDGGRTAI
jgi:NAD(P)-dependent dehydrogenase (short-subunit alcohol dehydrogenase family)